jgi:hypothetical protein
MAKTTLASAAFYKHKNKGTELFARLTKGSLKRAAYKPRATFTEVSNVMGSSSQKSIYKFVPPESYQVKKKKDTMVCFHANHHAPEDHLLLCS